MSNFSRGYRVWFDRGVAEHLSKPLTHLLPGDFWQFWHFGQSPPTSDDYHRLLLFHYFPTSPYTPSPSSPNLKDLANSSPGLVLGLLCQLLIYQLTHLPILFRDLAQFNPEIIAGVGFGLILHDPYQVFYYLINRWGGTLGFLKQDRFCQKPRAKSTFQIVKELFWRSRSPPWGGTISR